MDYKDIKRLIDDMGDSKIDSLKIEFPDGVKISMSKNKEKEVVITSAPQQSIIEASAPMTAPVVTEKKETALANTENKQENLYTIEDIAKEIYAQDDILAVNVGTELYFFDTKGWLIKKYTASQEITDVMLSKNLATVIYKDKIIIIGL